MADLATLDPCHFWQGSLRVNPFSALNTAREDLKIRTRRVMSMAALRALRATPTTGGSRELSHHRRSLYGYAD